MSTPVDIHGLSVRIARAEPVFARLRGRFAVDPPTPQGERAAHLAELRSFAEDFGGIRDIAGQATFQALSELTPGPVEDDLVRGLRRWVYELLQERVGWPLAVDEVEACHARRPESGKRPPRDGETTPDEAPAVHRLARSFAEARRLLVGAPAPQAAADALRAASDLAAPVAAVRKEQRARRVEVAARLGLDHPWALVTTSPPPAVEALARAIFDRTEPLAVELHKERRRRAEGSLAELARSPAHAIHLALGRDAAEGWPARLHARWLEETFRAIAPRPPRNVRGVADLEIVGASSFLRAVRAWGAALRTAGAPRSLPFVLARDPYPAPAHALGDVLALVLAGPAFARRKLGLSSRSAAAHARILGQVALFELRTIAALVITGFAFPPADLLEELGARLFGAPLPQLLGEAWGFGGLSGAARVDVPVRLLGAVRAHGLGASLVERFDDDWFDNPKAGAHLGAMNAGPAWSADPVPEPGVADAIARAFEEALG
jgi:hypothetical protein